MVNNFKELRKINGYTQRQVASFIDVSQQTYSDYENCKTEPTIEVLIKIADLYDVTLDELVGREIK